MTLKELREKLGWTREKMAGELGVSFNTLLNWESGRFKPSRMAQEKINALLEKQEKERQRNEKNTLA